MQDVPTIEAHDGGKYDCLYTQMRDSLLLLRYEMTLVVYSRSEVFP